MSQPEDPLRRKSDLTSQSQILPAQTGDQERQEQIEQRRAPDPLAMRSVQAHIDRSSGPLPKLPPAANLRSLGRAGSRP
jgi:hypothetical protein